MTGTELRRLRERAGVTQAQLAKAAGVVAQTIIRWEHSRVPIADLTARGLREVLEEMRQRKK